MKLDASWQRQWGVQFTFEICGLGGESRVKWHLSVTYIVPPANFVYPGIRFDVALEEDIDSLAQS